ncbi:hypothetical protein ACH4E7_33090 [Kitasatospora sp. NPDC018058]|uniref:hypothetical protein n=1 Tax=Kitasatospora sp. NPDC018058 TaxID=3364025 RepID=UPI0037C0E2DC
MIEETSPEKSARSTVPRRRHAAPGRAAAGGVLRSSALMAAGTVVSRATGLIRQVLQAAALGTGLLATTTGLPTPQQPSPWATCCRPSAWG